MHDIEHLPSECTLRCAYSHCNARCSNVLALSASRKYYFCLPACLNIWLSMCGVKKWQQEMTKQKEKV